MAKRVHLSELREEDDHDLRLLLEKFIRKSEELEKRESKVLEQVELVQSAVASLQAWKNTAQPATSAAAFEPPHIDVNEIERETQQIREETERLQKEVTQKMEENRKLQEEIERRRTLHGDVEAFMSDKALRKVEGGVRFSEKRTEEIETRSVRKSRGSSEPNSGVEYFNEKLRKLKELERRLKRELEQESEEARRKKKMLTEKMDQLERGSQVDRRLISNLKGKSGSIKK